MGPVSAEGWVELQSARFARVTGLRHSEKLKQPWILKTIAIAFIAPVAHQRDSPIRPPHPKTTNRPSRVVFVLKSPGQFRVPVQ
jgi:hypothetical protein